MTSLRSHPWTGAVPFAAALTTSLLAGCGSSSAGPGSAAESPTARPTAAPPTAAAPPASLTLVARDFSFEPTALQAPAGALVTLTFTNQGAVNHSFTPLNGLAVDTEAEGGKTETLTFHAPSPGTINFHCKYHPAQMTGTLTITGAAGSAPVPPAATAMAMGQAPGMSNGY